MELLNQGVDIVAELGGINTLSEAEALFQDKLEAIHRQRLAAIKTADVLLKIANAITICKPAKVFIHTGSEADRAFIRELAVQRGEERPLAMPDHTLHYDLKEEQGRIIDRTYYIHNEGETVSPLARKIPRVAALEEVRSKMGGIMEGMTMMVGFFVRGPIGAPVSNPALEITSSAYVTHSADLLYRHAFADFDREVVRSGHFYTNIHSQGLNRPEDLPDARVFMDRSYRTTFSFNCTYAGNTLLLKKGNHRFSVDRSIYEKPGTELAEHMFITGIVGPEDRVTWCAGAAPSGCGKTTTAMAGGRFIGDDLAQMWIAADGTVRSTNPECGIFGIVEDVNWEGDPRLMELLRKPGTEVIWSNVLVDDQEVPHWVGNGEQHPAEGFNFQGEWQQGMLTEDGKAVPLSHPNARCTLKAAALGNYSDFCESAEGVETRIITYSGRDSDTMPPLRVAKNSAEGVVIGATIVSAATATEVGAVGVRRQPWANAPFIPGSLADYMQAQFDFFGSDGIDDAKRPIIAGLNYFLTEAARGGDSDRLLGEKKDVKAWLGWLERRAHGEVAAIDTPIGYLPLHADLKQLFRDIIDKDYPRELYEKQFSLYIDNIIPRIDLQLEAYGQDPATPEQLFTILKTQKEQLLALRDQYGPVVTPTQLEAV